MITIEMKPGDLENIRFAYSPLIELMSSYCVLRRPYKHQAVYHGWLEDVQHALHGYEFPYLDAVVPPQHYMADFATPTPTSTHSTFEDELARIAETPTSVIHKNILYAIEVSEETEIRRHFLVNPRDALDCLTQELRLYWQLTMSHHWSRIRSVLENDVLFQAREMALHGVDHMFEQLSSALKYRQSALYLDKGYFTKHHHSVALQGNGIYLVPAVFARCGISWQVVPEWEPMVIYGARGAGLWYRAELPEPDKALRLTLGTGRAKVLVALQSPAHTTELSQRLNLTSGAVSQHLRRLSQAGLVESHRNSHHVYYRLTTRGENLVRLFTA